MIKGVEKEIIMTDFVILKMFKWKSRIGLAVPCCRFVGKNSGRHGFLCGAPYLGANVLSLSFGTV